MKKKRVFRQNFQRAKRCWEDTSSESNLFIAVLGRGGGAVPLPGSISRGKIL